MRSRNSFDYNQDKNGLRKVADEAVKHLWANLVNDEVYIKSAKINGKRYSVVVLYPGDNE